jgi:hypothetical protein
MHRYPAALTFVFAAFLLRAPHAHAQTLEAAFFGGAGTYENEFGSGSVQSLGLGLEVLLRPQLALGGELGVLGSGVAPTATVALRLQTTKRQALVPFVLAGLGWLSDEVTFGSRCYGGGLLYWPTRRVGLRVEYRRFERTSDGWEHFSLGRAAVTIR